MKTIQGSTKATKAAWTNLVTGIADDNADFDKLVDDFVDSISATFDNLIPRILTAIKGIGELIPKLGAIILEHLPEITEIGENILNGLMTSIIEILPKTAPFITQILLTIVQLIIDNLPSIFQTGITILITLIRGISQALPSLIPTMIQVIMDMVNILLDNIDLIVECGIQLLIALTEGIMNALPELISRLPEIIIKLVQVLLKLIYIKLPQAGRDIVDKIIDGLFGYWNKMIQKIREFFKGTIFEPIVNKITDMAKVGLQLVQGLWNGIKNARDWLLNKIKGFAKTITNGIKSFFGIHSPSKLFRDEIGKNLILGVGVAFEKDDDLIDKQINDFGDDVYKKMQGAVNMETGKMAFSGTAGSVNQILSSNATFDGNFVVKAEVQEGTLFEANQRITKEKRLQTGFGG